MCAKNSHFPRRLAPSLCGFFVFAAAANAVCASQERIFRCGNLYTNLDKAGETGCEPIPVDRISVVQSPIPSVKAVQRSGTGSSSSSSGGLGGSKWPTRVTGAEQRQKDGESRQILEAEWRKAKARLQELHAEYNHGEPERLGTERNNPQKYLDRVAALKSSITRTEADLSGIRRELARMGVAVQP